MLAAFVSETSNKEKETNHYNNASCLPKTCVVAGGEAASREQGGQGEGGDARAGRGVRSQQGHALLGGQVCACFWLCAMRCCCTTAVASIFPRAANTAHGGGLHPQARCYSSTEQERKPGCHAGPSSNHPRRNKGIRVGKQSEEQPNPLSKWCAWLACLSAIEEPIASSPRFCGERKSQDLC